MTGRARREAAGPPRRRSRPWVARALVASDAGWCLLEPGFRPALEHEIETRLAVGNGLLGVRGSLEQPSSASRPRTFVAGLFETPEHEPRVPALVPAPDWTCLALALDGEPVSWDRGELLAQTRTLDLRRGVLLGDWQQRCPAGPVIHLRTLRCVSLANRALALQVASVEVDRPAAVMLAARLEPPATDLELDAWRDGLTVWRTPRSGRTLGIATHAWLEADSARRVERDPPSPSCERAWTWPAKPNEPVRFVRAVAIVRGEPGSDPGALASAANRQARRTGLARLLAAHERAWAKRWRASDVVVEGDEAAQRALRFAVYHLVSAANPTDKRVSVGARALTGEAYLGHVFWDTEIFLLPFYTLTWPEAARALLLYRYHTLPAARAKAAQLGYSGALYAWESADTGEEATPPWVIAPDGRLVSIRNGTDEIHVSAAVAYAVWQYWQATGDARFLREAGAEILFETARFWNCRAALEADGLYHIRGVIGPDEYHGGVDDNAYTNGMARWNLERGLETAALLQRRWPKEWAALADRLGLDTQELRRWGDVAAAIVTGFDPASGLYEQFAGYFGLAPVDLSLFEPRAAPLDVLLGPERTQRSQVIKQADVLMLLALLAEPYDRAVRETNYRYYEPRCGHGSSLSPAVHALLAARLGDLTRAERYFRQAAAIDLDDTMGNAALGIHIGALGGLWQAVVFGFAGLSLRADGLGIEPCLPPGWECLRFRVRWRGRCVAIDVAHTPKRLTVTLEQGQPLTIHVGGRPRRLRRGSPCTWRIGTPDSPSEEVPA